MYQYSTYDSVYHGQYEGGITLQQLTAHGHFGLGTFDSLEGELVALQDQFYHCTNGQCTPALMSSALAWAAVCRFTEDERFFLGKTAYEDLKKNRLNQKKFGPKLVAIELIGVFEHILLTSTKKQEKPYPSIEAIIEESITFNHAAIEGNMVGWFAPDYFGGIKNPGFHFHFVDENRLIGGHVLDFSGFCGDMKLHYPKRFYVDFFNDSL